MARHEAPGRKDISTLYVYQKHGIRCPAGCLCSVQVVMTLEEHLLNLLDGGHAYDTFDDIVGSFKESDRGLVPLPGVRSAWQILEHMRRSLRDILEFSLNFGGTYKAKRWPEDYWPENVAPKPGEWDAAAVAFLMDRETLKGLCRSDEIYDPLPWGDGKTLLREILLAADHQAYHLGQLVQIKEWITAGRNGNR